MILNRQTPHRSSLNVEAWLNRRKFVASTSAATLTVALFPTEAASTPVWINLVKKLQRLYSDVSKGVDWVLWSQDAANAMLQGKVPPPSPTSPSIFYSRLQEQQTTVSGLVVPPYEAALPGTGSIPSNSLDAVRTELRSRVSILQDARAELTEGEATIKHLKLLESSLDNQHQRLNDLGSVLERLASEIPVAMIAETLLFRSIDVQTSYVPTVEETQTSLRQKREQAEAQFTTRRIILQSAAIEMRNLLLVEAAGLILEVKRLQELDGEVAILQKRYTDLTKANVKARDEARRQETFVRAAKLDVQEAEDLVQDAQMILQKLDRDISDLIRNYDQPYLCPVSQANWATCTEASHSHYKDTYLQRRQELQKEIGQLRGKIKDEKEAVSQLQADLQKAHAQLNRVKYSQKKADEEYRLIGDLLDGAIDRLGQKVQAVRVEKWKSRADLFIADNALDQSIIKF